MASPFFYINDKSIEAIAFALKHIVKLYPQWQHWVIVRNNHIAETGFIPVNDRFIHKELRQ